MIVDVKAEVRNALLADANLVSLLGGNKVYSVLSPNSIDYPYITLQQLGDQPIEFEDNAPTRQEVTIQIDVWAKNDYTDIVARVDAVLSGITTARYVKEDYAPDLFDFETRVLHKPLRYWVAKELS